MLPHLQLDEQGRSALAGCQDSIEALDRLERAGLLIEATRLIAHALPAREAVWWACACSRLSAASGTHLAAEAEVREAAEEWVRKPTDEHRRAAMKQAETTGFGSAEAWAAIAAFWSGDSMAPPEAPKVPPTAAFHRPRRGGLGRPGRGPRTGGAARRQACALPDLGQGYRDRWRRTS